MSIFGRISNIMDSNSAYNLPFSGPGSHYQGHDFFISQIDENKYELNVGYNPSPIGNYSHTSTTVPAGFPYGSLAKSHYIDAPTVRDILDGKSFPNLGLIRMTTDEKERLAELRKELEIWKKQQKLNKFKEFPTHIRQEIVDEAIVSDMISKIHGIKDTDFPGHQELHKLSSIKLPNNMFNGVNLTGLSASFAGYASPSYSVQKYYAIISLFTKDELINAHIEASIDDEISN
ncbi:hypothetical protein UFOVP53_88 [uncultured Caudovirales phage]|uniref:Uncharacterized protein n=1 Tax=uncultured Caudovirales phage TaxID=2100421 RepID=A0A6J5KZ65_9CAUD|nr:hypothetical protein UFOVP53_88 [uncultured Caudovirales phage]